MIPNKSIRHAISLIHFAIGVFCTSIFILYAATEAKWSLATLLNGKESFFVILLGIIGLFSFFGALSWQTVASQVAKKITYTLSLFFLLEYLAILFISSNSQEFIIALVPTLVPAVFLFLIAFSKINQLEGNKTEYNNFLDADFLVNEKETPIFTFWKPNRIVSLTTLIFSILLFPALMSSGAPFWTIFIPSTFLIFGVMLWLLPKTGSWIFSVISVLAGIGLVGFYLFLIKNKPINAETDKLYIVGVISLVVVSLASLGWGLAMLLLSKEAKQEWETNKNTTSQIQ
jgi:uncharacterized membrane protein YidH (DUF202 family)